NFVRWLNFPLIKARRWHFQNVVLLGDAAHTAHFSIGSGTKLAMEDSIALAESFRCHPAVAEALPHYQWTRKRVVDRFQVAALRSLTWLENVESYLPLDPLPFSFRLMTRSQRVSTKRIQMADPAYVARYQAWKTAQPKRGPIPEEYLDLFQKKTF